MEGEAVFRFTIRDLFWIMFIVGFSLWTLNYRQQIVAIQQTYLARSTEEIARREQAEARLVEVERDAARFAANMTAIVRKLQIELEMVREAESSKKASTASSP